MKTFADSELLDAYMKAFDLKLEDMDDQPGDDLVKELRSVAGRETPDDAASVIAWWDCFIDDDNAAVRSAMKIRRLLGIIDAPPKCR